MDGATPSRGTKKAPRALVAGGAGFVGAHLCQRLLAEGYDVTALDNLVTGSLSNLGELLGQPRFHFVQHDVCEPYHGQADLVFNLACCASPVHYQARPLKTLQTCLDGAVNMLEVARLNDATIFQASTSEIYGEPEVHPQREDYRGAVSTIGPRACYDEGKRCAEAAFFDYHRLYGTDIKVGRIFNTYGPRMRTDDGRVVSNLIVQALRGEPLTLYGDGSQTRSFCYVSDLVEGIMRLMASPRGWTGPVNLGNPHEITVAELAERVLALTGSSSRIVRRPVPKDDPTRRCPDIGLARGELGWEPQVSLDDGLRHTIAWFQAHLSDITATMEAQRDCA
ncbi:SDR family oxidoreductase [Xanthomonas sp. AmX2]|uniref:UDP-glucuronic acid decarboxylase family protein n=1 Tax=Xanthomonas sp. TaxID=29446 RepID=UPI001981CAD9|nr:UDP-glucuronic acid decarboxylase family protein [Xanthomonas sp.]MBN6149442.1 SDR family oxidoreductase [Xanthomonas sp.]